MSADLAPLRRRPVQQRSAQRVERMLNACAELIHELGYDRVTTTLIAERAGVAVGSLYQFFPDKRAVVQALTLRNLEQFLAAVERRFAHDEFDHWWDGVDVMFDIYTAMHRDVPGFGNLHFGDLVDLRLLDTTRDNNMVITDGFTKLLSDRFQLSIDELRIPIAVAVESADAVLKLAFRMDPRGNRDVVREAKELIRGYLATRFGEG